MSIERGRWGFHGEITFECDECGEEIHTEESDFPTALSVMKKEGWKSLKGRDDDWGHLCPTCVEGDNDFSFPDDFSDVGELK